MWVCLQEPPWRKRLQLYFRKGALLVCLLWVCLYPTPLHAFFFTLEISLRLKMWRILAVDGGKLAETAGYSSKVARVRISPRGLWVYQYLFTFGQFTRSTPEATRVSGVSVLHAIWPQPFSKKQFLFCYFRGDATSRVKRGVKRESWK